MNDKIELLKKWVNESKRAVFFGGAGVSTESGIPDFRSVDGLYNQKYDYPPETILSGDFFRKKPTEFFRFYYDKMIIKGAEPNITHKKLAELEQNGHLAAVVTQNIDGLHQAAGSENVLELHGSVHRNYCRGCGKFYSGDEAEALAKTDKNGVPRCGCGEIVKPDVVLYGEQLDYQVMTKAISAIEKADLLIIGGTSLTVYPAAGFIRYFGGDRLVLINKSETPFDGKAQLVFNCGLGSVFSQL